ncbi:MAG: endonuclease MutS2 [Thermoflexales bacterium]
MFVWRHLETIELHKVLERLAKHCAFSASVALARQLSPSADLAEVNARLEETRQARLALERYSQLGVGGARDVRDAVRMAMRGARLEPAVLLDIRDTLASGRTLQRHILRLGTGFERLAAIAQQISPCASLQEAITAAIDDRAEVRDTASARLQELRAQVRAARERLIGRLQRIIQAHPTWLQEPIITQRNGRCVLPVKADFKGRLPGIVHDQSASGLTLFIEPLVTVELNNQVRELELAESHEVNRILSALSAEVGVHGEAIIRTVEALARLDLALACARYADELRAAEPRVVESGNVRLTQARHPLIDPQRVVPIDVHPQPDQRVLVITGPNTGGKTVALKTIGLFAAMAQCGLHVPAQEATLPLFHAIFADIGDEQSIEQSLSTFSSHLTNIVSFLPAVDAHTLVLLDELAAGTDPLEGSALARALLEHLLARGAFCVVATHFPELKTWAALTPGAANASVAFDYNTLQPLYQLSIGLPGKSNALLVASRLGVPEDVVARARSYLGDSVLRVEDLLAEITQLRAQSAQALAAAQHAQAQAEQHADQLRQRLNQIEEERRAIHAQAREAAQRELSELRAALRQLRNRLTALGASLDEARQLEQALDALEHQLASPSRAVAAAPVVPSRSRVLRVGDVVRVKSLAASAEVVSISGQEADVRVGQMRARVRLDDLEHVPGLAHSLANDERAITLRIDHRVPSMELDLRGLTTDEGVARVEAYLDRAARAGLPFARLIHGKGTGALRRAIREAIRNHPSVVSFETGSEGEGSDGVTIVQLRQS